MRLASPLLLLLALPACGRLGEVGRAPDFETLDGGNEQFALYSATLPLDAASTAPGGAASLWSGQAGTLFDDRRAARRGDILTVVIEIDDEAEISNETDRSRTSSTEMGLPQLFGIPQRLDERLPEGASMAEAVEAGSASRFEGAGSVSRSERLTLRVAATVVEELPNGALRIEGTQEVRVNHELRALIVTGFVRPADITRQNEVPYDRIAGARISYGGRGRITEVQQPGWGQQVADTILPF